MTTQPEPDRLHHLLDRARRGVILPAEGEQLAVLVENVEKDLDAARERIDFNERDTLPRLHRRIEADADTIRRWRGRAETAELKAASEVDRRPLHARHVAALTDAYPDLRHTADHIANLILGVRDEHVRELEQRVAELTAGQCTQEANAPSPGPSRR